MRANQAQQASYISMVQSVGNHVRRTLSIHSAELRYIDPRTLQVYQGTFLIAMCLSLLTHDMFVQFGIDSTGVWQTARALAGWQDRHVWSVIAGVLGCLILITPSYTKNARLLLFFAFLYWFSLTVRAFSVAGFLPLSVGLTLLLSLHAVHGYIRMRYSLGRPS